MYEKILEEGNNGREREDKNFDENLKYFWSFQSQKHNEFYLYELFSPKGVSSALDSRPALISSEVKSFKTISEQEIDTPL